MTKTAVIYLRVSTERQARKGGGTEGFSIPAQREACHRKAKALGVTIINEYLDAGESARSADRPSLKQMLADLATPTGAAEFVIVHKLDRLARNRGDDVAINMAIRDAGAALVSCTENIDDTPSGALMHSIMAGIAEFYSKNLAVEVKKGLQQKARTGGTPGRTPPGYLNAGRIVDGQEVRIVEIDPERAPHIEWMFKSYATGDYTISDLQRELESRGCRSRKTPKVPSKPYSRSQIHRYLSSPYYVGVVTYGGVEYEGNHQPLIDLDTFRTVQTMLATNRTAGDRSYRHQHYLKGSLFCGHCGAKMTLTRSRGRNARIYPYFYCLGRNKGRTDCQQAFIAVKQAEAEVEKHYGRYQISPAVIADMREAITSHIAASQALNAKEVERQKRRLKKLDDERRKLLQAHYADAVPVDLLKEEQSRIGAETAQAERIMASCATQFEVMNMSLEKALDKITNLHVSYRIADDEGRRKLNQALFEKLFIVDDEIAGADLAEPYQQLLDNDIEGRIRTEQQLPPQELFKTDSPETVSYERRAEIDTETVKDLLNQVDWHPYERPLGALPIDTTNPAAYYTRRGSNLTLLAEGVGFEPTVSFPTHAFQACRFGRSRIPPCSPPEGCERTGHDIVATARVPM